MPTEILTPSEAKILSVLIAHRPEVVTVPEIVAETWGTEYVESDYTLVRTHICRVRRKLGFDTIQNIRGRGYRVAS